MINIISLLHILSLFGEYNGEIKEEVAVDVRVEDLNPFGGHSSYRAGRGGGWSTMQETVAWIHQTAFHQLVASLNLPLQLRMKREFLNNL